MVLKKVLFTSVMLAFFSTVACGEWIQPWPVALNVGYLDLGGTVDITNNSIRAGAINGNPQTFQQRLNSAFDDFLWTAQASLAALPPTIGICLPASIGARANNTWISLAKPIFIT